MLTASDNAKRIAYLASLLDAGTISYQELGAFLHPFVVGDLPNLGSDHAIAVRHVSRTLRRITGRSGHAWTASAVLTLKLKTSNGTLGRNNFEAFFEHVIPSGRTYSGAGPFALSISYMPALMTENVLTPDRLKAFVSTKRTYVSRDIEPDMHPVMTHIRNVLTYSWRWPTSETMTLLRNLDTMVRHGERTLNHFDHLYEEVLP